MSNEFTWTCPRCGRAVPRRVDGCRCGHTRVSAPPAQSAAPAATAEPAAVTPPPRAAVSSKVILLAAGLVSAAVIVAAVVVAVSWRQTQQQPARAPAPAMVATAAGPTAPPATSPPAGELVAPTLTQLLALAGDGGPPLLTVEEVVARSLPAVVKVETRQGLGSGFFVSADRLLTNAHVVGEHKSVNLRLTGGQKRTAVVDEVWRDVDLAVLKIDIVDLDQVFLPIAAPSDVRVGGEVIAIGSPLGLQNTVTRGIISGTREYVYDRIGHFSVRVVQTDAAINPGNSGGPLIDRYGRVVGVNTLKLGGLAEGLGFAVEMYYARRILGPDFALKSAADQRREDGLRRYDDYVRRLAQRADEVEAKWKTLRPQCFTGVSDEAPVREWFLLRDAGRARLSEAPPCQAWQRYFQSWANNTHDALEQYRETALLAGVPAAQLRAVRRMYDMAWPAWEE